MNQTDKLSNTTQELSENNQETFNTPRNQMITTAIPVTPDQPIVNLKEPPNIKLQKKEATNKNQQERLRFGL